MMHIKECILRRANPILLFNFKDHVFCRTFLSSMTAVRAAQGTKLRPSHLYSIGFPLLFLLHCSSLKKEFKSTTMVRTVIKTTVSEVRTASIIRAMEAVRTSETSVYSYEIHGAVSQRVLIRILATVKTWNCIYFNPIPFSPPPGQNGAKWLFLKKRKY
jgi:hypothetical protein